MFKAKHLGMVVACIAMASPLRAQQTALVFRVDGGAYTHPKNLDQNGSAAFLKRGYDLSTSVGLELNKYLAIDGDATFGEARGSTGEPFLGRKLDRYFVGGDVELRYPIHQFVPFAFAGGGAVILREAGFGSTPEFQGFTRGAGLFGGGLAFRPSGRPIEVTATSRWLTYRWTGNPVQATVRDATFALGVAYRVRLGS